MFRMLRTAFVAVGFVVGTLILASLSYHRGRPTRERPRSDERGSVPPIGRATPSTQQRGHPAQLVLGILFLLLCFGLTSVAAAMASGRERVEELETDIASRLEADYSADPRGIRIAPLDPNIVGAAASDEEALSADSGEARSRVPIAHDVPTDESSPPEPSPTDEPPTQALPTDEPPTQAPPTDTPASTPPSPSGIAPAPSSTPADARPTSPASPTQPPTASNTATATDTPTDTATKTPTPTVTSTTTPKPSDTPTATKTPSNTPSQTPVNTPTSTAADTDTPANTLTPTDTASNTPTPADTPTSTAANTDTPTNTLTPTLSNTPTATDTPTSTPSPTAPPGIANVFVFPAGQTVGGPAASIEVRVANASNLGSYAFTLTWDDTVLSLSDITNRAFLGSTGRLVLCLPPIQTADSVTFTCDTLGLQAGPDGSGVLAQLDFATIGEGPSPLGLSGVSLTSMLLVPQPSNTTDVSLTVQFPTATPTPTPVPTATPTPPAASAWYLHNNPSPPTGNTGSQTSLPLGQTVPAAATLYNYSTDLHLFPGRHIHRAGGGADVNEFAQDRNQVWRTAVLTSGLSINGSAQLVIWSGTEDFRLSRSGAIRAFLRDFDGSSYTEITEVTLFDGDWQEGSSTWVSHTLVFPSVSYTLAAGHRLEIKVLIDNSSDEDMNLAYDAASFPSRLILP